MRYRDKSYGAQTKSYGKNYFERRPNIFSTTQQRSRFENRGKTISPSINKRLNFDTDWGGSSGCAPESPLKLKIRNEDESFYTDSSEEYTDYSDDEDYSICESDEDESYEDEEEERLNNVIQNAARSSRALSVFSRKAGRKRERSSRIPGDRNFDFEPDFSYFQAGKEKKLYNPRGFQNRAGRYLDVTPSRAYTRDLNRRPNNRVSFDFEKNQRERAYISRNKPYNRSVQENIFKSKKRDRSVPKEKLPIESIKGTYVYGMDLTESKRVRNLKNKVQVSKPEIGLTFFQKISDGEYKTCRVPQFSQYLRSCKAEYVKAKQLEAISKGRPTSGEQVYLPKSFGKSKTLLLDMDETLIHSEEFKSGVSYDYVVQIPGMSADDKIGVFVRPYCKEFLREMKKQFEVVIFTAARQDYADEVLNSLDPYNEFFDARLYRQNCTRVSGTYVKDFRVIKNRNPRDLILVDNLIYSFAANLGNGIPIKPYLRGKDDFELEYLGEKLAGMKSFMDIEVYLETHFGFREFYQSL